MLTDGVRAAPLSAVTFGTQRHVVQGYVVAVVQSFFAKGEGYFNGLIGQPADRRDVQSVEPCAFLRGRRGGVCHGASSLVDFKVVERFQAVVTGVERFACGRTESSNFTSV